MPIDPHDTFVRLLDQKRAVRRSAIESLENDTAARFALRTVLLTDPDAAVRARAAERLGEWGHTQAAPWLQDALGDGFPSVRDAAWRALARTPDPATVSLARRAIREETVWWVRRSAVFALASVGGFAAIDDLRAVLDDPFWRVRFAALQALAVLGDASPRVRDGVLEAIQKAEGAAGASARYLRERWENPEGPTPAGRNTDRKDETLWNADPAVIAGRLLEKGETYAPEQLVEHLGNSHEALRFRAVRLLARCNDEAVWRKVLLWLEDPIAMHAREAVTDLFDRIGSRALYLAKEALAPSSSEGAKVWAAGWAARNGAEELGPLLERLTSDPSRRVRCAALAALGELELGESLLANVAKNEIDSAVREAAIVALARCGAAEVVLSLDPKGMTPRARRSAAAVAVREGDDDALGKFAVETDSWARAAVLAERVRRGMVDEKELQACRRDEDPWVRGAVLDATNALSVLEYDGDPWLRRAAFDRLLVERRELTPEVRLRASLVAANARDSWLRSRSCVLLRADQGPEALRALLRLNRDTVPSVRASSAERLELCADIDARLRALLAEPATDDESGVRRAAYTWLLRARDERARALLAQLLTEKKEPAEVLSFFASLAISFDEEGAPAVLREVAQRATVEVLEQRSKRRERVRSVGEGPRRVLGRSGIVVSPLALSGVWELPEATLDRARERGVSTYFWEPRYLVQTRWLARHTPAQRDGLTIVTGTYHGDAPSIERDVATALRRLKTNRIDVFLLFWVRAQERLNDDTFAVLERLKKRGMIRAHGFSTHHRDIAATALKVHPWDVVMTRHSAAHTGAETELFPVVREVNAGLLTFSALCYGRMLRHPPGAPKEGWLPSAPDCYRYSLSQEGVGAVIAAPARPREVDQNLVVLAKQELDAETMAKVRTHGISVREENKRFNNLVRAPASEPELREVVLSLLDDSRRAPAPVGAWS